MSDNLDSDRVDGAIGGNYQAGGHGTSDELIDQWCDTCLGEKDRKIQSESFCFSCNTFLCNTCNDFHSRFIGTKNHSVARGSRMPKSQADKPVKHTDCIDPSGHSKDQFCMNHGKLVCGRCTKDKHKKCNVQAVSVVIKGTEYSDITVLKTPVTELQQTVASVKSEAESHMRTVENQRKQKLKYAQVLGEKTKAPAEKALSEAVHKMVDTNNPHFSKQASVFDEKSRSLKATAEAESNMSKVESHMKNVENQRKPKLTYGQNLGEKTKVPAEKVSSEAVHKMVDTNDPHFSKQASLLDDKSRSLKATAEAESNMRTVESHMKNVENQRKPKLTYGQNLGENTKVPAEKVSSEAVHKMVDTNDPHFSKQASVLDEKSRSLKTTAEAESNNRNVESDMRNQLRQILKDDQDLRQKIKAHAENLYSKTVSETNKVCDKNYSHFSETGSSEAMHKMADTNYSHFSEQASVLDEMNRSLKATAKAESNMRNVESDMRNVENQLRQTLKDALGMGEKTKAPAEIVSSEAVHKMVDKSDSHLSEQASVLDKKSRSLNATTAAESHKKIAAASMNMLIRITQAMLDKKSRSPKEDQK